MLVTVDAQVLTDLYELRKETRKLLDELSGYLSDPPLVMNSYLHNYYNTVEKLTCEGTEHD